MRRLPAHAGVLALEPVDEISVLTVCDNAMDMLLPDEGPAKRLSLAGMGRYTAMLEAPTLQEGKVPDARSPSTGSPPWSRSQHHHL